MAAFLFDGMSRVGEAVNPREERGEGGWYACNLEMGRGAVCGCSVT